MDIRRRILRAFEAAEFESDPASRRTWTTFVVIGGGPTGVELAGAIAEIAGCTLASDFRRFDPRTTRVVLIEAAPRVLSGFSEHLSSKAQESMEGLGIEVRTGTPVSAATWKSVPSGYPRERSCGRQECERVRLPLSSALRWIVPVVCASRKISRCPGDRRSLRSAILLQLAAALAGHLGDLASAQ